MIFKLLPLPPGSIRLLLPGLAASLVLSCANSTAPPPPPPADAGHAKDATVDHFKCGSIGEECCAPPTQCLVGSFCAPDGTCRTLHPSDIGAPCSSPSACQSGICGYTQGIADGAAPVMDGNGTPPPQTTGCTVGCYSTMDCTPGWTCDQLTVGEGVCSCSWSPEICDGLDNNCDGLVDNQPEVDNSCTQMNMGIPEKCEKGGCVCVNSCNGVCVDIQVDPNNCGKCSNVCTATIQKCVGGECVCNFTMCGTECVDTQSDDNANCGGCDVPCAYQCHDGACGPATFSKGTDPGTIVLDATNVYWIDNRSNTPSVLYCPLAGCGGMAATVLAKATVEFGEINGLQQLFVTPTTAYFTDGEEFIDECPLPPTGCGGKGTEYATTDYDTFLAGNAADLVWVSGFDAVDSCAQGASCPSPKTIASFGGGYPEPAGVAAVGKTVYFATTSYETDSVTVESATIGGGGSTSPLCSLSDLESLGQILIVGPNLYFSTGFSTYGATPGVYVCPLTMTGGPAALYAKDKEEATGLATDGTNLYWTDHKTGGAIKKCALGTTCAAPTTIIAGTTGSPDGIAATTTSIYWTSDSGGSGSVLYFHN